MKISLCRHLSCLLVLASTVSIRATDRFVSLDGGNAPPFTSWADAATNIQDAIDAASPGDTVWVTNGVYAAGGKVMAGDLTNRVALDKALTVQSVNGPFVTTIQGAGATNGPAAVRCAWLTNGASLVGFTVEAGATRTVGDTISLRGGGAVWCASSNSFLFNCVVRSNAANSFGAGVYQGSLSGCAVHRNICSSAGSVSGCVNSLLTGCTVISNSAYGVGGCRLTNCIVYFNSFGNSSGGTFSYCCTTPLPSGEGNISAAPQLLPDAIHMNAASPCRGKGTNLVSGTDIDGQVWSNPPSIGCDEWQPAPTIFYQPKVQLTSDPVGFTINLMAFGQEPFVCWWTRDGTPIEDDEHYHSAHTTNLVASGVNLSDAGNYQVVVSNQFGMATSTVAQVVVHCVDSTGYGPVPPYVGWPTAATNIQDAIEAAQAGEFVLVTNGVYAAEGKVMAGDLTNRVALTKALTVVSVNGPAATMIKGAWDPLTTNGPSAVRCAWVGDGATLSGFTLQGGATRNAGDLYGLQSGGGVWGASSNSVVVNCVISTNNAAYGGGGAYQGRLSRCTLVGNNSGYGGGSQQATLVSCAVLGNFATTKGGGVFGGSLSNCTVTGNSCPFVIAGYYGAGGICVNCIVYNNFTTSHLTGNWGGSGSFSFSCTTPPGPGTGNITTDPQLLDGIHLAVTSPCRNAGSAAYTSGTDIDGEAWATPPSMGCDEVWEAGLTGPLLVDAWAVWAKTTEGRPALLVGQVTGRASRVGWWFGDGAMLTNTSSLNVTHAWTTAGDYTVTFTAFNTEHPEGISTNVIVQVVPLLAPAISVGGLNGNSFNLSFFAQPLVTYVIEQTTNLAPPIAWETVGTVIGFDSPVEVTDNTATNAMRFYRVRTQ